MRTTQRGHREEESTATPPVAGVLARVSASVVRGRCPVARGLAAVLYTGHTAAAASAAAHADRDCRERSLCTVAWWVSLVVLEKPGFGFFSHHKLSRRSHDRSRFWGPSRIQRCRRGAGLFCVPPASSRCTAAASAAQMVSRAGVRRTASMQYTSPPSSMWTRPAVAAVSEVPTTRS